MANLDKILNKNKNKKRVIKPIKDEFDNFHVPEISKKDEIIEISKPICTGDDNKKENKSLPTMPETDKMKSTKKKNKKEWTTITLCVDKKTEFYIEELRTLHKTKKDTIDHVLKKAYNDELDKIEKIKRFKEEIGI